MVANGFPSLSIGVSVLDQPERLNGHRGEVTPPADVRIPTFGAKAFDIEYADATWESIRRGTDSARRLGSAMDWLGVASLNTTALTDAVRIPALRAGMEVLLGTDNFLDLGNRLAVLVKDSSQRVARNWNSRSGAPQTEQLSDVSWWCVQFSFLRNKLMHGTAPNPGDWVHDGRSHIDLGEWYLREAIKHTVASDGHARVLENRLWRAALDAIVKRNQAMSEADEAVTHDGSDTGESTA